MWEGKRETPQWERTSQGREPAAKKSESLSRGKRVPKQKDDNEVGAAVCKEIHIDEFFITDLKEYMDYYNNERIKLRLNGMSPVLYRKAFEQSHSY